MESRDPQFVPQVPHLDMSEGTEMLTDFSREAQRHLISARNSLIVLETMQSDKEAIENIFKTFHTIKGLADFLKLYDIHALTQATETMIDLMRKGIVNYGGELLQLIPQAIEKLQILLELLDEQIANNGTLISRYIDISALIASIKKINDKNMGSQATNKFMTATSILPIMLEPDMSAYAHLEKQILSDEEYIAIDREALKHLVDDFKDSRKTLQEAQSKLKERQRELIKERELAIKLTKKAQTEARAKSEYLANMSHEIRTLINAILGFTEILKTGLLNNKQKEHLNTIVLSGKMLLGIVNDILDFSKVEAGKLKFENIDFNLKHIIEEVFKIIRTRLGEKPVNLYMDINDNVPLNLIGDPTRLKQIFINLLDNAIKFTEEGEIGMTVTVLEDSKSLDEKPTLHFVVKDTGIGIPEDHKKSIFESFTQADPSTTRLYGGSGLGLTLCKTFVETMGGEIFVESELGKGSQFVFTIKLPLGKKTSSQTVIRSRTLKDFANTSVLIVDQHKASSQALAKICRDNGLIVTALTDNAKQASELLLKQEASKETLPNIIFIDTLLKNKEGFMLAYKIKQHDKYKDIKLIAVSPDVKIDTTSEFRQAGFGMFLAKPVIEDELLNLLLHLYGDNVGEHRVILDEMLHKISCEGIRVLVVEDSIPNVELLKVHLESLGCVCDYAANGQEAVDYLRRNSYDICFMDLHMPILDGLTATKIIREELKLNTPVVALTAAEIQEEKEHCLDAGMNDYLAKPFGVDELKKVIIKCTKM